MGYFFTLLFILTAYITPPVLFGPLAGLHLETVFVGLAVIFSLSSLRQAQILRTPQAMAVVGLACAIAISVVNAGWFGGVPAQIYNYTQQSIVLFLVSINCKKRWHLQGLVIALLAGSLFFMAMGLIDLRHDVYMSPYIFGEGELRRIRGLGFVNDPNDLGQVFVSLIPALFLLRKKRSLPNLILVGLLCALLLVGMYFTHSRGASLALMAIVLVSARKRVGTLPAAIIAGLLLAAVLASGWSGGRDVSMEGGADRLDLWYQGLQMLKAHPLFGVGIGGFADKVGITAHNSVVICAAETGFLGLFFWVMLLFTTIRTGILIGRVSALESSADDAASIIKGSQVWYEEDQLSVESSVGISTDKVERVKISRGAPSEVPNSYVKETASAFPARDDVRTMAAVLLVSMTGFLTAGWFLSRSFSMWLFVYCGMLAAVWQMGKESGLHLKQDSYGYILIRSLLISMFLIAVVSIILRLRGF